MSNPGEHLNDEIDLIKLVLNLWDQKWLIAGVSAAAFAVGGAYVALTPNSFEASVTIRPVDAATIDQFRTLNNAAELRNVMISRSPSVAFEGPTTVDSQPTVINAAGTQFFSATGALAEFAEVLLQRETIAQAADQYNMVTGQQAERTISQIAVRSYAFDVEISPVEIPAPSPTGSSSAVMAWRVKWVAYDEAASAGFIAEALRLTNEATRQRLTQRLIGVADQIRLEQSRRSQQIETAIANAIEDYQVRLNDQLAYLSEQASLARMLGIEAGAGSIPSNAPSESMAVDVSSAMSYLDGYRALDEQITILSSRGQVDAFVPGLRDLQAELRHLEQDHTLDELLEAIEATPLSDVDAFRAAQYDLAAINITYHKKTRLILALSLLLGGFLGAIVALMRSSIHARQANR